MRPKRSGRLAAEAFGQEVVAIEVALVVAVGVHARHLGEDVLADNGLVRGNDNAAIRLDDAADIVQAALIDARHGLEMVFQDGLHGGQRGIAGPLSQPVDGGVQSPAPAQDGSQDVGDGQVIIVVRVEVEVRIGIPLHHLAHILDDLQGIEYAQRAADRTAAEGIHQLVHIVGRFLHAAAPVLQVKVRLQALRLGIVHHAKDVGNVLVRRLLQLVTAMLQRAFAQQVDDTATGGANPVNGFMPVHEAQHLDTGQEPAAFRPVADDFHGVVLSLGHTGGSHFHAVHLEVVQEQPGNHQFLVGNEGHAAGLLAVAQGGVHYFNDGMTHRLSSRKTLSCPHSPTGNQYRPGRSSSNASCRH